jgi:hypothetical protein
MLTRVAIFMCIASVCFAGDRKQTERELLREWRREEQRHKKLAAQPTPAEWHVGAVWRFVTTAPPGKPQVPTILMRVTDERAQSCTSSGDWKKNDWRRLARVDSKAPLPPIFQVDGRALWIEVAGEICDVYDSITGVLTGGEFKGQRRTSGLGVAGEELGTVQGSYVSD